MVFAGENRRKSLRGKGLRRAGGARPLLSPLVVMVYIKRGRRDLNPQPPDRQSGTLPIELRPQKTPTPGVTETGVRATQGGRHYVASVSAVSNALTLICLFCPNHRESMRLALLRPRS